MGSLWYTWSVVDRNYIILRMAVLNQNEAHKVWKSVSNCILCMWITQSICREALSEDAE
jgi:hypothetical protein